MSNDGWGFSGAAVCPTTQAAVLSAVVLKLQTDCGDIFPGPTIFISDAAWPVQTMNDELFCTVCPADGDFEDTTLGGGSVQVFESSKLQVTIWSKVLMDQYDRTASALLDSNLGLLTLKRRILKSLAGQQMFSDYPTSTIPLLTEWLRPIKSRPMTSRQNQEDYSSLALVFEAPFNWDLS